MIHVNTMSVNKSNKRFVTICVASDNTCGATYELLTKRNRSRYNTDSRDAMREHRCPSKRREGLKTPQIITQYLAPVVKELCEPVPD